MKLGTLSPAGPPPPPPLSGGGGVLAGDDLVDAPPPPPSGGGGVLAGDDLVDALSEAAVGGEASGRLPQVLQAAAVGAGDGRRTASVSLQKTRREFRTPTGSSVNNS